MLWHQVMRPNERGWRGKEGESAREDVLCICTLHVPIQEKVSYVKRSGGIERASWRIRFRGARNSGPEAGFDQVKVSNGGPEKQCNHEEGRGGQRVQEGRCLSSQNNLICFVQGGLGGR